MVGKNSFDTWISGRPLWLQSAAAQLLESQRMPGEAEISGLADLCLAEATKKPAEFKSLQTGIFEVLPMSSTLRILQVAKTKGVNTIRPGSELNFGAADLAVVYGANGAGKSGFVRLLKGACGARTSTQLLPNVFSAAPETASAEIVIERDGAGETLQWTQDGGPLSRLRNVQVFDSALASTYVTAKNPAVYEPRRMRFLSSLIQIAESVMSELERRRALQPSKLPVMPRELAHTNSAAFFTALRQSTAAEAVTNACAWSETDAERRRTLEAALKEQDVEGRLRAHAGKQKALNVFRSEWQTLQGGLSDESLASIYVLKADAATKRQAASEDANKVFSSSPLTGIGQSSWRLLWEQARAYSEGTAYPGRSFPAAEAGDRCVLCQQPLEPDGRARLAAFESFVNGGLESAAKAADKALKDAWAALPTLPGAEQWGITARAAGMPDDMSASAFSALTQRRAAALSDENPEAVPSVDWAAVDEMAAGANQALAAEGQLLAELQKDGKRAEMARDLDELTGREWIAQQRAAIECEIARLVAVGEITAAMGLCKTNSLTSKKNELAQEELTKGYQDRFASELKALGGSRIRVEPVATPEGKGKIAFSIKIKDAKTAAQAHAVLSEGEQRIVALAAFLADITGSGLHAPFVFDDPISSLDQEFEERVVARLVALAKTRQVIVFTHRLSLPALLEDALDAEASKAKASGGSVLGRHFVSLRQFGGMAGFVDCLDIRRAKPLQGFKSLRDNRLPKLRKLMSGGDADGYDAEVKAVCGDFRILVERTVEKTLLNSLVERFRRSVQTQQVYKLSNIKPEDCALIDGLMSRYSCFEHSQSDEIAAELPELDELAGQLDSVIAWITEYEKR